jgi:prepilin-type N-terminal cleavage/methylation domain-containing protein
VAEHVLSRLRREEGMSLPELLVAMVLMLVVMTATLNTLDAGGQNRRLNDDRNDAVERARSSMDNVVRQLRNLASPTPTAPSAIDRAQATDFAFRTFDPNKRLVRYCLETNNSGTIDTSTSTSLIQMLSTSDTLPLDGSAYAKCTLNTNGWSKMTRVAEWVVNQRVSTGHPAEGVFVYNGNPSNTATITNVRMNLQVDVNNATKRPEPVLLASGAALRNQNQRPVAMFTVTNPGPRRFIMNATSSSDPENHNLLYTWYLDRTATFTPSDTNVIGNGPVFDYTVPTNTPPASDYYFKLVVSDSNLSDTCPTSAGDKTNCTTAGAKTL